MERKMVMKRISLLWNAPLFQPLLLVLLVFVFYFNSFFQIPRSDHISYLYAVSQFHHSLTQWWPLTKASYALNRVFNLQTVSDTLLFRPVLYAFLALEQTLWGYHFKLWQFTSIALHGSIVLAIYYYGRLFFCDRRSSLPFLLALFFALLFGGAEMVAWTHVVGYLLFCLLLMLALIMLQWFLLNAFVWEGVFLTLFVTLSAFTYELGNVLALLVAFTLLFALRRAQTAVYRRRYLIVACVALCVPAAYIALSLVDYYRWFGNLSFGDGSMGGPAVTLLSTDLFQLMYLLGYWIVVIFVPTAVQYVFHNRIMFNAFYFFSRPIVILNSVFAMALAFSFWLLARAGMRGKMDYRRTSQIIIALLLMIAYIEIIVIGRGLSRGLVYIIRDNTYYAYPFAMLVVLLLIQCLSFVGPYKDLLQRHLKVAKGVFVSCLLILVVFNAVKLVAIQREMRDFCRPFLPYVERMVNIVHSHRGEANASFVVSANCMRHNAKLLYLPRGNILAKTLPVLPKVLYLEHGLFPFVPFGPTGKYRIDCEGSSLEL